jgi:5-methylcytosine-specific restriction endonuclease McrA
MPELRDALGDGVVPNEAEHLNRRLRKLRENGWKLPTNKDDRSIPTGTYRVDSVGWYPGEGERPPSNSVSLGDRRRVFERDQWRCVVCGVGSNEPYPSDPATLATLTVGHRIPNALGGSSKDINNLQTECARCNEPVREALRSPETLDQLRPDLINLSRDEARKLESWVLAGRRGRDKVDATYDRIRPLSASEKADVRHIIRRKVHG